MLKKLFVASAILAATSNVVFAGMPYVGASFGVAGYKSKSGLASNIFGGYGTTFGPMDLIYLGGELAATIAHYSKYSTTYGMSVSLIPGISITQSTKIYGRLGLNAINVRHILHTTNWGTQYGTGIQTSLTGCWDVRGEYVYSNIRNAGQYNAGLVYNFG